ncbi:hypothetical protein HJC23_009060 [Cyclotella cryptica]|uniref:Leucine-rich repeat-containing N-terminal plant-type domain-containing protein n=1 Tax=Cyclotella cryptica TaxID=29204 RepID=A0ABD3QY26_9STRA|eukprot:CCRYP_000679-RA/>CCRYP_000679-RA protein AED:0.03 eAED:0.02 QI:0/0/0/1/1/1/2/0/529
MDDEHDEEAHAYPNSDDSGDRPSHKKKHKKKKKSKHLSVEDAIEKKLREKKKKEEAAAAAEDALAAKIRAKQQQAAGAAAGLTTPESEEEKVEEGLSVSEDDSDEPNYAKSTSTGVHMAATAPPSAAQNRAAASGAATAVPLFTSGGGDVRNRPPPGSSSNPDPLRAAQAAEEERKKNAKKVNDRFADLHQTGQWGGLSKWEIYGLCFLALAAVGVAIGLGVKFANDAKTEAPTGPPTKSPTNSPSLSPTPMPTNDSYRVTTGLDVLRNAGPALALRVNSPEELVGASSDPNATPQEIAAEFVLYDDRLQIPARDPRFVERYALVVFYYSNGGCSGDWIDSTNWMTETMDHCQWYGVVCDLQGRVTELAMEGNYVTGNLLMELSQLQEMSTLDLSNNRMDGTVPLEALNISSLFSLRLGNNEFSGDFPFDKLLDGAPLLNNLWIQENSMLTGEITDAYCGLFSITLDCDNFEPQPTYTNDGDMTTFEAQCIQDKGIKPTEYTCNTDVGVPVTRPPSTTPTNNCGTPLPA